MKKIFRRSALFLALTAVLCLFLIHENNALDVTRAAISGEKIPAALDGFKILHISDLHSKRFGKDQRELTELIRLERPNLIVITGDLTDSRRFDAAPALELMRNAVEIAPVYFVTGNHENRLNSRLRAQLMKELQALGVTVLNNQAVSIPVNDACFYLIGLDDSRLEDRTLQSLCANLEPECFRVLLAHEPQHIERYARLADLAFAGHAHGGQVRLPGVHGLFAPNQGFFPKYTEGIHQSGSLSMVVSRGLGNSLFPFRLFNRPEIVCVTLTAESLES